MDTTAWRVVVLAAQGYLGLLFLSAAWGKLAHRRDVATGLPVSGLLPPATRRWLARLLPGVEALPGPLLLVGWYVPLAAALLALLLVSFIGVIALSLRRGQAGLCQCSGLAGTHPLSWGLVGRNLLLLTLALLLVMSASSPGTWAAWAAQWQQDLARLHDPVALLLLVVLPVSWHLLGQGLSVLGTLSHVRRSSTPEVPQ